MTRPVLIGASIPSGVEHLELFRKLKLGEVVLTGLPTEKVEALAVARYCKQHKIFLYFHELLRRGTTELGSGMAREDFYTKDEFEEIMDAAGGFYRGRYTIGEAGGVLYWLRKYPHWKIMPPVRTVVEARDAYVTCLSKLLEFERNQLGKGPLVNVEASLVFKYHAQAGVDAFCTELVMQGDPHLIHAAIRGAARVYAKTWGVHNAIGWYGGVCLDELWQKRWKNSLYYSYIGGAEFIILESGCHTYTNARGQDLGFHSKEMKRSRGILREVHQFSRIHTRPPIGPKVEIGVVYGNLDGAHARRNKYVWGQDDGGEKWLAGPAEKGWDLIRRFHEREQWCNSYVQGEVDFSGNPPYGQYDVVPIEAPLETLESYACLIFLGWNTMTAPIYNKLKGYVRAGGHLVMYLPHLSTHTDRADDLKLFRNGDFRDLFGVKVLGKGKTDVMGVKCIAESSLPAYRTPLCGALNDPRFVGRMTPARLEVTTAKILGAYDDVFSSTLEKLEKQPLFLENSLGKGKAFLVAVWEYPGDDDVSLFTEDVLRTVMAGEQGDIRLLATDRLRYAVYEGPLPRSRRRYRVIYLLNTDPDCPSSAKLWIRGRTTGLFTIPANDMRIAYCLGDTVIIPEDRRVDLKRGSFSKGSLNVEFSSVRNQDIEVHDLGKAQVRVCVNGAVCVCQPGTSETIKLPRTVDPAHKEFFSARFLEEASVEYKHEPLPY